MTVEKMIRAATLTDVARWVGVVRPKAVLLDVFDTVLKIQNRTEPYAKLMSSQSVENKKEFRRFVMTKGGEFQKLMEMTSQETKTTFLRQLQEEVYSIEIREGAVNLFDTLNKNGVKWALCSNLATPYARHVESNWPWMAKNATFSCDVGWLKPDKEIFEHAARRLGCVTQDVWMVGNSYQNDAIGAIDAGCAGAIWLTPTRER